MTLTLDIDSYFINKFINGKSPLPETETFTILTNESDEVKVVIGYSEINSNRVELPVK